MSNVLYGQQFLTKLDSTKKVDYWVEQSDAIPFSPTTTLDFSFPDSAIVNIEIHKVSINQQTHEVLNSLPIRKLLQKELPGGHYRILWDLMDSNNRRVEKGLYIFFIKIIHERGIKMISFEAKTKLMPL